MPEKASGLSRQKGLAALCASRAFGPFDARRGPPIGRLRPGAACGGLTAPRKVFFPRHMSPEKTNFTGFRACGRETLRGALQTGQAKYELNQLLREQERKTRAETGRRATGARRRAPARRGTPRETVPFCPLSVACRPPGITGTSTGATPASIAAATIAGTITTGCSTGTTTARPTPTATTAPASSASQAADRAPRRKRQGFLPPLLRLSPPDPLRWAPAGAPRGTRRRKYESFANHPQIYMRGVSRTPWSR